MNGISGPFKNSNEMSVRVLANDCRCGHKLLSFVIVLM